MTAEWGNNPEFIRGTWLKPHILKAKGIIFPSSLIFIGVYNKIPFAVKALYEKKYIMGQQIKFLFQ